MKTIVINNSGNVGKSFISREVFFQNMNEDRLLLELETHNSSSNGFNNITVEKIRGDEIKELFRYMNLHEDIVVDVGASNIENFLKEISKSLQILDDIDYFIVPAYSDTKQTKDTIKTLELLSNIVEADKLKVIFNRVDKDPKSEFKFVIEAMKRLGVHVDLELSIYNSEAVEDLDRLKLLSSDLASDEMDYKQLARERAKAGDKKGSIEASDKQMLKIMAANLQGNVTQVFNLVSGA